MPYGKHYWGDNLGLLLLLQPVSSVTLTFRTMVRKHQFNLNILYELLTDLLGQQDFILQGKYFLGTLMTLMNMDEILSELICLSS